MRSIDILRTHALNHAQALKLVEAIAEDLAARYGATYHWEGESLRFERSGIKGAVHVLPKQVHIRAELGFLFIPLRSAIEAQVVKFLDEHASSTDPKKTEAALKKVAGVSLGQPTPSSTKPAKKVATKTASKKVAKKTTKSAARKKVE